MKAVLFFIGIRGDTEPFLAIGQLLKERGWEVISRKGSYGVAIFIINKAYSITNIKPSQTEILLSCVSR